MAEKIKLYYQDKQGRIVVSENSIPTKEDKTAAAVISEEQEEEQLLKLKTINGESIIGEGNIDVGGGSGTTVVANPELAGDEDDLHGLQVGSTKYKIPVGGSGGDFNVADLPVFSVQLDQEEFGTWGLSCEISIEDFQNLVQKGISTCLFYSPYGFQLAAVNITTNDSTSGFLRIDGLGNTEPWCEAGYTIDDDNITFSKVSVGADLYSTPGSLMNNKVSFFLGKNGDDYILNAPDLNFFVANFNDNQQQDIAIIDCTNGDQESPNCYFASFSIVDGDSFEILTYGYPLICIAGHVEKDESEAPTAFIVDSFEKQETGGGGSSEPKDIINYTLEVEKFAVIEGCENPEDLTEEEWEEIKWSPIEDAENTFPRYLKGMISYNYYSRTYFVYVMPVDDVMPGDSDWLTCNIVSNTLSTLYVDWDNLDLNKYPKVKVLISYEKVY